MQVVGGVAASLAVGILVFQMQCAQDRPESRVVRHFHVLLLAEAHVQAMPPSPAAQAAETARCHVWLHNLDETCVGASSWETRKLGQLTVGSFACATVGMSEL